MDHFQVLKQTTVAAIFEEEYKWIKDKRWWLVENNQANMLLLLDADTMSLVHLNQVRQWMQQEKNEIAKKEAEGQQKMLSGQRLTGGHRQ